MKKYREFGYGRIYRVNADKEWRCGAYDEYGNAVSCDICGADMKWNERRHLWACTECRRTMNRDRYFEYIMAVPPGVDCITNCGENYPFCKKYCEKYEIDPNDPIL